MKSIFTLDAPQKFIITGLFLLFSLAAYPQNVGINNPSPRAHLDVTGNFIVSSPFRTVVGEPSAANTHTMVNGQYLYMENDSIVRFFDPGGPAGGYLPNMMVNARCSSYSVSASHLEITIETLQLGTGDSLKITDDYGVIIYNIGNTTINSPIVLNSSNVNANFHFKSNADASVGQGFSVLVRYVYANNTQEPLVPKTGYGIAFRSKNESITLGRFDQQERGTKSVGIGSGAAARGSSSIAIGDYSNASSYGSIAIGSSARSQGPGALALGEYANAEGNRAVGIGAGSYANGYDAVALAGASANGNYSLAAGESANSEGQYTFAMGYGVRAKAAYSMVVGRYNQYYVGENSTSWVDTDPLFVIGNGTFSARSNALTMRKDGRIGLGIDFPAADLHIRQSSSGGIILQNPNDNNKWRIYSASGDNNLTFYNNSNVEIADIDDVTGTFSALSDARFKKNISPLKNILALVMQLTPTTYQFNWQDPGDEKQIGMLAQEAYKLFPELVSYDKEKDLYKMNYAGFSTVAIRAIQEQQQEIDDLKKRLERLEEKLNK